MTIINHTHWKTEHLRAFVSRVAMDELSTEQRARLRITFRYGRAHGFSSGYAYYNSHVALVRLSKRNPSKIDLAYVIAHELAHTRGMHHRSMANDPRYRRLKRTAEIYAWADALPLEVNEPKKKKRPGAEEKLVHSEKMLRLHEIRLKRQTTLTKKWRAKVKRYENQLRKAAAKPEPET